MTVVTISGLPGTGKSTVAQLLHKRLGLRYVYSGEIFRSLAKKHGMSLECFGSFCEEHPEIDRELDDYQIQVLKQGNVLLEGRIAGFLAAKHQVPAVKVLLTADLETRVGRIIKREQGDYTQRRQEIITREACEAARYKKFYGIDVNDTSIYDIIVDTVHLSPEEIVERIVAGFV
jgi:CMP/dCMP kinase